MLVFHLIVNTISPCGKSTLEIQSPVLFYIIFHTFFYFVASISRCQLFKECALIIRISQLFFFSLLFNLTFMDKANSLFGLLEIERPKEQYVINLDIHEQ